MAHASNLVAKKILQLERKVQTWMNVEDCQVVTQQMRLGWTDIVVGSINVSPPNQIHDKRFCVMFVMLHKHIEGLWVLGMCKHLVQPQCDSLHDGQGCRPYCMLYPYINVCQTIEQAIWFRMQYPI